MPNKTNLAALPEILAAVDLGSNSFHLQISRVVDGQLYMHDSLKETVRLGSGITTDKTIEPKTAERALNALKIFGERLRGMPPTCVRAVGTNTFRVAKNAKEFVRAAEAALGYPIEIIAGREEARLIYLGVAHGLPPMSAERLVVDIGGGSTEFIIGTRLKPKLAESLYMGCVSYSERYFADGKFDKKSLRLAQFAAQRELETIASTYRKMGWKQAIGSSGTAKALAQILAANDPNQQYSETEITRAGLLWLRDKALDAGSFKELTIPGVRADRIPVLAGGLAIMLTVLEELDIKKMLVVDTALRQGVLVDMLGRTQHEDIRTLTVSQFAKRYHVDQAQADRVERMAVHFLSQLQRDFAPDKVEADYRKLQLLQWACQLHETGIDVAQSAYHKHSAYLLAHADMPGFSKTEQVRLSALVLGCRGKLEKLSSSIGLDNELIELTFCLRLAVLLCRSRRNMDQSTFKVSRIEMGFKLSVGADWLAEHNLTEYSLKGEAKDWAGLKMRFEID
jgi:exopolyphosphatase / guanosine-5'-triphosphate,3'-diphosphate pyrophosphatase